MLELEAVGHAGLGETGCEEVDGSHAFRGGVFQHGQDISGRDGADYVVDRAGDVGETCEGGQSVDHIGLRVDGIDVGLSCVAERSDPAAGTPGAAAVAGCSYDGDAAGVEDGIERVRMFVG